GRVVGDGGVGPSETAGAAPDQRIVVVIVVRRDSAGKGRQGRGEPDSRGGIHRFLLVRLSGIHESLRRGTSFYSGQSLARDELPQRRETVWHRRMRGVQHLRLFSARRVDSLQ